MAGTTPCEVLGRLHRLYDGKSGGAAFTTTQPERAPPLFQAVRSAFAAGYEAVGYTLSYRASAIPGWPDDVPLPPHHRKRDYATAEPPARWFGRPPLMCRWQ